MHLIVLVRCHVEERVALLAGVAGGARIRADQESLALGDRAVDRLQDVGEDRADHEIDLVALEQAAHLDHGAVGLQFVVGVDDLDLAAGHLAAEVLDRERKAVADLLAKRRSRAGGRHQHADLDLLLRGSRGDRDTEQRRQSRELRQLLHVSPPTTGLMFRLRPIWPQLSLTRATAASDVALRQATVAHHAGAAHASAAPIA